MKKTVYIFTTLFMVIFLALSNGWAENTNIKNKTDLAKKNTKPMPTLLFGQSLIPAVFAFQCSNDEGDTFQPCPVGNTLPYGNNKAQLTHSWFQMVNNSKYEETSENSELRLYLYGKDGNPVQVDDSCSELMKYNQDGGYIDLLNYAGEDRILSAGEAIFLYIHQCSYDGDDNNPPYYAKLSAKVKVDQNSKLPKINLNYHAGWEEIVETQDNRLSSKAGTLADKRVLKLKPFILLPEESGDLIDE
jgi:hypothetical protein